MEWRKKILAYKTVEYLQPQLTLRLKVALFFKIGDIYLSYISRCSPSSKRLRYIAVTHKKNWKGWDTLL